jgi:hypothetical protein
MAVVSIVEYLWTGSWDPKNNAGEFFSGVVIGVGGAFWIVLMVAEEIALAYLKVCGVKE